MCFTTSLLKAHVAYFGHPLRNGAKPAARSSSSCLPVLFDGSSTSNEEHKIVYLQMSSSDQKETSLILGGLKCYVESVLVENCREAIELCPGVACQ